jgi:hypothetical protein
MTTAWVRRNGSANSIVARFASGGRFRQVQVHAARRDIASPTLLQDGPVAVFAWQQRAGLTTDVRARAIVNGSFGLLQNLTGGSLSAGGPAFVSGPDGVRLAWLRGERSPKVEIGRLGPRGRFVGTTIYDIPGLVDADVALTRDNRALVAYTKLVGANPNPRVTLAEQGPNGLRDTVQFNDRGAASDPTVAIDGLGRTILMWAEMKDGVSQSIYVAVRPRGATEFSEPREFADGVVVRALEILPSSDGDVLLSWLETPSSMTPDSVGARLRVGTLDDGVAVLSQPGRWVINYGVAVDGAGAAHFAWNTGQARAAGPLYSATVTPSGVGLPRRVTAPGEWARSFSIGASAGGRVAAAWATGDGRRIRQSRRR